MWRGLMLVVLTLQLSGLSPGEASAADPCAGALSAEQIRGCLAPPVVTRGFAPRGRGIVVEGQDTRHEETTVNLLINFEFNSARLTNDGQISLDALGKALADPSLRDGRFQIAGHTDAVGSDAVNQKLSEARAAAVRDYLAMRYGLAAGNFEVVGYGKTRLYDTSDPMAAINRRVQITKLGN